MLSARETGEVERRIAEREVAPIDDSRDPCAIGRDQDVFGHEIVVDQRERAVLAVEFGQECGA